MDAQHKWEMTALNAIEQAAQANSMLATAISDAIDSGNTIDPKKLLSLIRENQARLARDVRQLRRITTEREASNLD
jgi:hypothetical protein